jgi:hypothetical protein
MGTDLCLCTRHPRPGEEKMNSGAHKRETEHGESWRGDENRLLKPT